MSACIALTSPPVPQPENPPEDVQAPQECMPCRGTGRVISNLGGEPSTVPCPWCEGTGVRHPEIDAQAHAPHVEPAPEPETQSA